MAKWKLVPVEPTELQIHDGGTAIRDFERRHDRRPGDTAVDDIHTHKAHAAYSGILSCPASPSPSNDAELVEAVRLAIAEEQSPCLGAACLIAEMQYNTDCECYCVAKSILTLLEGE